MSFYLLNRSYNKGRRAIRLINERARLQREQAAADLKRLQPKLTEKKPC